VIEVRELTRGWAWRTLANDIYSSAAFPELYDTADLALATAREALSNG
jgi:hypothetical protein